jgi:hypothetical protein
MIPLARFCAVAASLSLVSLARAAVEVKEMPDRVRIEIDGQLFTELRFTGAPHVYYGR